MCDSRSGGGRGKPLVTVIFPRLLQEATEPPPLILGALCAFPVKLSPSRPVPRAPGGDRGQGSSENKAEDFKVTTLVACGSPALPQELQGQ